MIKFLTSNRLSLWIQEKLSFGKSQSDQMGMLIKGIMFFLVIGLGLLTYRSYSEYQGLIANSENSQGNSSAAGLPSIVPVIGSAIGCFLALVALLTSFWIRESEMGTDRRQKLIVLVLWIAAIASLVSWMPGDVIDTREAIQGKALAGESPSIPAYIGKLLLLGFLLISIPMSAMLFFRLSLMDQYVVKAFLSPFLFCMFAFVAIWAIFDYTDNGPAFSGLPISRVMAFYVVQVPFVVLFVMPIVILLSSLFALSNMSKSNELISMIGAGRSVLRILAPLLVLGVYCSAVSLAFKYEWAPRSVGYKEAMIETAKNDRYAMKTGSVVAGDIWAKRGWMYINEVEKRTWFVGRVPLALSEPMADIVIWQFNDEGELTTMWKAARGKWIWDANPPRWEFVDVKTYQYGEDRVPLIHSEPLVENTTWSETPWKVLSSSQNPEYLGVSGLNMYLRANEDMDQRALAPFWTNWWYIFAEPAACFVMILVAAPLGIVYSRRGVMAGVTGAIIIFALMYIMRGTLLAMGQGGRISPFMAAWGTNIVIALIGVVLLWFRARNREVPTLKSLFRKWTARA